MMPQYRNILVLHFGQLGDVVLGLPAMAALRKKFADSRIVVVCGRSTAEVIELAAVADQIIYVDRVALRDGPKSKAVVEIIRLVGKVRKLEFDLVIDLHSLPETNLLAAASRAKRRLLARRQGRSLNFLSNFSPAPPDEDRDQNLSLRYVDVLKPLGITVEKPCFRFSVPEARTDSMRVGIFPGAGHPSRRWPFERFGELTRQLIGEGFDCRVFLGPEERAAAHEILSHFPPEARPLADLPLADLINVLGSLDIFISNDTGPMHLAACAGSAVVLIMDERAPKTYLPITDRLRVVDGSSIDQIPVESVYAAAKDLIRTPRDDCDIEGG